MSLPVPFVGARRRGPRPHFSSIRPLEDRFAPYQESGEARLERHRLLTKDLRETTPAELGA